MHLTSQYFSQVILNTTPVVPERLIITRRKILAQVIGNLVDQLIALAHVLLLLPEIHPSDTSAQANGSGTEHMVILDTILCRVLHTSILLACRLEDEDIAPLGN